MIEKILNASDRGKYIILYYLPQASKSFGSNIKFKLRTSERTASASVYFSKDSNQWKVTDFGDEGTALSCFDIAMKAENMNFREILNFLSEKYGVGERLKQNVNYSRNEVRPAKEGEKEEDYTFKYKEEPSIQDLKCFGELVTQDVLKRYNYYSVESYTHTYKNKETGKLVTLTVKSNDNYPIFVHEVKENDKVFRKIYAPLAFNKKDRFFSAPKGAKPKNLINGLDVLQKAYNELNKDNIEKEPKKLPACIICSGERDAMNVASLGYFPIWLNSESAELPEYQFLHLKKMCERIYNIPDIDGTGKLKGQELALKYLDIYTVILPERLKTFIDVRGRKSKDLRDYLQYNPTENDFKKLLNSALSCKFWETKTYRNKPVLSINTEYLLYYLHCNGFAKIVERKNTKYVKIDKYIVTEVTAKDIRNFVYQDLKKRYIDNEIINLYLNSNKTDSKLADDLPTVNISFKKFTHNSRTFFFLNKSITVYSNKIENTENFDIENYVWSENICKHNFYLQEKPQFSYTYEHNSITLEIDVPYSEMSNYFKFLINASRIYWRQEYEERVTGNEVIDNEYRDKFKFSIWGDRLTEDEKDEQQIHLMNKIFSIGYLLHRYKKKSQAYALWLMENKLTEANESSGGSGKSFTLEALKLCGIMNIATLNGRDKKMTENKHLLDRVDSVTDCIQIDDTDRSFDFNYFYGMITNSMSINKKNQQSEEIDFKDSPIFAITSNFPPPSNGSKEGSTLRRLLTMVYSDYYHNQCINKYKETRKISDDFGCDLFDELYPESEYNKDINFLIQCLQFYLFASENNLTFLPPMNNVIKRMNINIMGDDFKNWAEFYFSTESEHLNHLLTKESVYNEFINTTGLKTWKPQRFTKALVAFCENNDLQLNPESLCNNKGRIIKNVNGKSKECIYLRTDNAIINDSTNLLL